MRIRGYASHGSRRIRLRNIPALMDFLGETDGEMGSGLPRFNGQKYSNHGIFAALHAGVKSNLVA